MGIVRFMVKCIKVGFDPRMRALRSIMSLNACPIGKSVVYTSYKSSVVASLVSKSLHKWSDNFFFVHLKFRSWAFGHIWQFKLRLDSFHQPSHLSTVDRELI